MENKLEAMQHNEKFLNDMWNGFTTKGKYDILNKEMGLVVFAESYNEWYSETQSKYEERNGRDNEGNKQIHYNE